MRHGLSLVPFEFVLARLAGSDDAEQEHTEEYPEHAPAWAAPAAAGGDTKVWERRGRTPSLARAIAGCKMGTLILSEFTACSHVIPGALRTNPWREEECARVFIKSLRQPAHERQHWQEQQLAWYYIVKRDLLQCQKRPITVSKETYYSVKRDLLQGEALAHHLFVH